MDGARDGACVRWIDRRGLAESGRRRTVLRRARQARVPASQSASRPVNQSTRDWMGSVRSRSSPSHIANMNV